VVGSAERRAAFLVDAVGAAQELLVKGLPRPFERVRHVAGAAILGSGEVALILNAADLLRAGKGSGQSLSAAPAAAPVETALILVADDSMTTRTLEKNILEAAGYRVRVAADGAEAWTILQHEPCSLLVSDVNMPRLDGFELTEKVRADDKLKSLPIVLVTSLDSRDDRERGIWAGADAYIVKGSFDQDVLLATIRQLI
jgi:two-component system chemotaxis sensor kinase CheA